MSSEVEDEFRNKKDPTPKLTPDDPSGRMPPANPKDLDRSETTDLSPLQSLLAEIQDGWKNAGKLPPIQVDDTNLLFYDVFLLINLSVS
jgi:hypothetical protein